MIIFISKALPEKRKNWEGVLQIYTSEFYLDRSRNLEKISDPAQKITQAWKLLFEQRLSIRECVSFTDCDWHCSIRQRTTVTAKS